MSRASLPPMVGNDLRAPQPKLQVSAAMVSAPMPVLSVMGDINLEFEPSRGHDSRGSRFVAWLSRHSLIIFACLTLLALAASLEVGAMYWRGHITLLANTRSALHIPAQPAKGPNTIALSSDTAQTIQKITSQPFSVAIDGKVLPVSPDIIKSWLQVVTSKSDGVTYIHVDQTAIGKSLRDLAQPYLKPPVNQVSVTHPDGSSLVIAAGHDGNELADTTAIVQQIQQGLLGDKGFQLSLPTTTQPYASVTATNFPKLIEVNLASKQMYLYENGQFVRQYAVSAGKPSTPTPVGQFKIFEKLAVQDMSGYNADGSRYFQPHVHWINYFIPGGYAIHGVYWHPLSWFGANNSSHGCVGIPDDQAAWVYQWAPIGTTVITHN